MRDPDGRGHHDTDTVLADQVTVVIATHQRAASLARTLLELSRLPEVPPTIVVANGCTDATPAVVADMVDRFGSLLLVSVPDAIGATARTVGARAARTPFVAFCDDDSWWAPGSLDIAVRALRSAPTVGAVCGHTVVGDARASDPINDLLAASPLPPVDGLPGPRVRGFLACALVVRRAAFLDVGGFSSIIGFVGEESLLAMDLVADGWEICYVADSVVEHHPSPRRPSPRERARAASRNELLTCVLRRPVTRCAGAVVGLLTDVATHRAPLGVVGDIARALPGALARRERLPARVDAELRLVERAHR
ncbi:MAG: glycosyltransferase [Gordonia paraffinivorans]